MNWLSLEFTTVFFPIGLILLCVVSHIFQKSETKHRSLFYGKTLRKQEWLVGLGMIALDFLFLVFCGWILCGSILVFSIATWKMGKLVERVKNKRFLRKIVLGSWIGANCGLVFGVEHFCTGSSRLPTSMILGLFFLRNVGYLLDIADEKISAEQKPGYLLEWLLFFPTLYYGPVIGFREGRKGLRHRKISLAFCGDGFMRIVRGLGKVLLLSTGTSWLFSEMEQTQFENHSVLLLWLGLYGILLSVYYIFSGFADMAIGMSRCFGLIFPENFGHTIFYSDVSTFLCHWNRTVVAWFSKHMGSRLQGKMKFQHFLAVVLTWICIGLWYRFRWTGCIWGLCMGLLMGMEHILRKKKNKASLGGGVVVLLLNLFLIPWLYFADWHEVLAFYRCFGNIQQLLPEDLEWNLLIQSILPLTLGTICCTNWMERLWKKIHGTKLGKAVQLPLSICGYILLLAGCLVMMGSGIGEVWYL